MVTMILMHAEEAEGIFMLSLDIATSHHSAEVVFILVFFLIPFFLLTSFFSLLLLASSADQYPKADAIGLASSCLKVTSRTR